MIKVSLTLWDDTEIIINLNLILAWYGMDLFSIFNQVLIMTIIASTN